MCQAADSKAAWFIARPLASETLTYIRRPLGARGLVQVPFNVFAMPQGAFFNLLEMRGPKNHLKPLRS